MIRDRVTAAGIVFLFVFGSFCLSGGFKNAIAENRTFVHEGNMKKKADEDLKKEKDAQHEAEFPDMQETLQWARSQIQSAKNLEELKAAQIVVNAKILRGIYLGKK